MQLQPARRLHLETTDASCAQRCTNCVLCTYAQRSASAERCGWSTRDFKREIGGVLTMAALAPIAMRWALEQRVCVLLSVARVHWPNAIQTQENPPNRGLNGRTWVDIDTNRIDMSMAKQVRYRPRSTLETGAEADIHATSYATNSTLLWMGWEA